MIISDLSYLENTTDKSLLLEGGKKIVVNQINIAIINQSAIAISDGGTANAINSASIVQSNSSLSASKIKSKAKSISS